MVLPTIAIIIAVTLFALREIKKENISNSPCRERAAITIETCKNQTENIKSENCTGSKREKKLLDGTKNYSSLWVHQYYFR